MKIILNGRIFTNADEFLASDGIWIVDNDSKPRKIVDYPKTYKEKVYDKIQEQLKDKKDLIDIDKALEEVDKEFY